MRKTRGFTLIELLVVVAIIALLIAILLPSLGKAREQARIAVCATHMKQIATGLLMYTQDYNGTLITAGIASSGVTFPTGQTPEPQYWANDLLAQNYLKTKNGVTTDGTTPIPSSGSTFYCPDGDFTANPVSPTGGNITNTGTCPRDIVNRQYVELVSQTTLGNTACLSWYTLNCHNMATQDPLGSKGGTNSGGGGACPFLQWNIDPSSKFGGTETLAAPGDLGRKLTMITAQQKMVMVLESSSISWDANGNIGPSNGGVSNSLAPTPGHPERLAGRHGDALDNGYDGYTNMAYFDGHVAKQSTVPYSQNSTTYTLASPDGGYTLPAVVSDTYFYFNSEP